MDSSGYDQLRARTDALQVQVDSMLESYEHQLRDIATARDTLAAATAEGWSSDNLIRVTSNSAGIPIQVWVDPAAFKRTTPEKLGDAITEAAQAAARAAKSEVGAAMAPILADEKRFHITNPLGEDLNLERVVGGILPPPPQPVSEPEPVPEPPRVADDDEDNGPHWKGW
ncbi:Nucleoid-associated protein YbaB [Nocardia cerradoensis]|uniref:Nucleoid-associated protein YbaB n=1 Tax=Nocardia cerradoensis TaxID=85688 RepID=A0A231H8H8_9NOCA|nr:YbaB/EbfC family nucleoid-associated protein [Nocardia cerradoensis]OXR45323.1 Nucleoid-associated protein YbaB [Nocardia cerradoensis]